MNISVSPNKFQTTNYTDKTTNKTNTTLSMNNVEFDSFTSSKIKKQDVSFKGLFKFLFGDNNVEEKKTYGTATAFASTIANGMKEVTGKTVDAAIFNKVVSTEEFRKLLENGEITEPNFDSTIGNIEKNVYCADLDNQTGFSTGNKNIYELLNEVKSVADNYYKNTGKDFIFAITDMDSVVGIQKILEEIANNPEKYEHIRILPGIKVPFFYRTTRSKNPYEIGEMLIYGINPYSKNIIDFTEQTIAKRDKTIISFFNEIEQKYPTADIKMQDFIEKNGIKSKRDLTKPDIYFRLKAFTEQKGKNAIRKTRTPDEHARNIFAESSNITGLNTLLHIPGQKKQIEYNKSTTKSTDLDKGIQEIFSKYYFQPEKNGTTVFPTGNTIIDIAKCFSNENVVMAIASPYNIFVNLDGENAMMPINTMRFLDEIGNIIDPSPITKEAKKLIGFESIAPSYEEDFEKEKGKIIESFNKIIGDETELKRVGGSFERRNKPQTNK